MTSWKGFVESARSSSSNMTLQLSLFLSDNFTSVNMIFLSWSGVTILKVTEMCVGLRWLLALAGLLLAISFLSFICGSSSIVFYKTPSRADSVCRFVFAVSLVAQDQAR